MTISDEARCRLHQRLDSALGAQEAATLMSQLSPMGWGDLATKRDLDSLGQSLRSEMATVRSEMGALEARVGARLDRELRLMTWRLITAIVAVMSVLVAAVRL